MERRRPSFYRLLSRSLHRRCLPRLRRAKSLSGTFALGGGGDRRERTSAPRPAHKTRIGYRARCSLTRLRGAESSGKISILREFWSFLRVRKKWWLAPIIILL